MDALFNTINKVEEKASRVGSILLMLFLNIIWMAMIGIAVWLGQDSLALKKTGEEAMGKVVDFEVSPPTAESGETYAPIVSYVVDNKEYTYSSSNSSDPPAFEIGEAVTVLYNPMQPSEARINTFFELWGLAAILALSGVVVGIVIIYFTVRTLRGKSAFA